MKVPYNKIEEFNLARWKAATAQDEFLRKCDEFRRTFGEEIVYYLLSFGDLEKLEE